MVNQKYKKNTKTNKKLNIKQAEVITDAEYLKNLDKDEKNILKVAKNNGTYNEFISLGKCALTHCKDNYTKLKELKYKCFKNKTNKYITKKDIKCYFKNLKKSNLLKKQNKCIKKNCNKEKEKLTKKTFQYYKKKFNTTLKQKKR